MNELNKKILLICPDFMGYADIISYGIKKYLDAEVHLVTTTGTDLRFNYRNSFHRLQNLSSKLFLRKNQKKDFYDHAIAEKLKAIFDEHPLFSGTLILRPDLIKEHLSLVKAHSKRLIAYFWDSFERIPDGKETIPYFDKFFSFQQKDANDHNVSFRPFFYPPNLPASKNTEPEFDLGYVASYDSRVNVLERIMDSLAPLNLKTSINITNVKKVGIKNDKKSIHWLSSVLPPDKTWAITTKSKVLLDIAQPKQEGLSFRPFDAIGLEKKLITTNQSIVSYDFFDPKNIFLWEDENTVPSKDFFTTPYQSPSPDIVKKYSLENWLRDLFE